jgi:hypothetical protein
VAPGGGSGFQARASPSRSRARLGIARQAGPGPDCPASARSLRVRSVGLAVADHGWFPAGEGARTLPGVILSVPRKLCKSRQNDSPLRCAGLQPGMGLSFPRRARKPGSPPRQRPCAARQAPRGRRKIRAFPAKFRFSGGFQARTRISARSRDAPPCVTFVHRCATPKRLHQQLFWTIAAIRPPFWSKECRKMAIPAPFRA